MEIRRFIDQLMLPARGVADLWAWPPSMRPTIEHFSNADEGLGDILWNELRLYFSAQETFCPGSC